MGCSPSKDTVVVTEESHKPIPDRSIDVTKQSKDKKDNLVTQKSDGNQSSRIIQISDKSKQPQESISIEMNQPNSAKKDKGNNFLTNDNTLTNQTKMDATVEVPQEKLQSQKYVDKKEVIDKDSNQVRQEALDEAKELFSSYTDGTKFIDEDGRATLEYKNVIESTSRTTCALDDQSLAVATAYGRDLYLLMAECKVIVPICDVIIQLLNRGMFDAEGELDLNQHDCLDSSLSTLVNFSDSEINRTDLIREHPTFLDRIIKFIEDSTETYLAETLESSMEECLESMIDIVYNMTMRDENVSTLRKIGLVKVLTPYMGSTDEGTRLTALASLGNILREDECDILNTDKRALLFLRLSLSRAIKSSTKRFLGWTPTELARIVKRIARNDTNKRGVVEQGIIPPLVELSESEDVSEQIEAVGALWTLSFDEVNQAEMIADDKIKPIDTFIRLRDSPDKGIQKICNGALWTMREKLAQSAKYKKIGIKFLESKKKSPKGGKTNNKGHVMLSYQWSNQELVKYIRDSLREHKFRVWMDIDDMGGSTVDAMAAAVESADVVLICYSNKYKDSDNCRSEAEYAFQKKKKVIPLKMEKGYEPDGWLGFILGAKLFFDFGGKYSFESRMEGLIRELQSKLRNDAVDGAIVPSTASMLFSKPFTSSSQPVERAPTIDVTSRQVVSLSKTEEVKLWTAKEVSAWIKKHNLPQITFGKLSGMEIAFMQVLLLESPDFFYKSLNEMLHIKDFLTFAKIRFALADMEI